ncbi:HTH domain-containing protein [Halomarina litorea]|uniref:HTH domain-containing protein n=1 Tax=Halomarina litorea TaxID=2961595 RepID=UPI0020C43035|nr:HTH domain-containing protein [Halomarina sp. BCD28]
MGHDRGRRRIELFTRASTTETRRQQSAVVERLRLLEDEGVIDGFVHRVWNAELCPRSAADRTPWCDVAMRKYAEFAAWCERRERTLRPFFDERSVHSTITGERAEVVVFPVTCVAVYDGDELLDVAPSRNAKRVYTVEACLAALERAPELRT